MHLSPSVLLERLAARGLDGCTLGWAQRVVGGWSLVELPRPQYQGQCLHLYRWLRQGDLNASSASSKMTPSLGTSVDLLEWEKALRNLDKLEQWGGDLISEWDHCYRNWESGHKYPVLKWKVLKFSILITKIFQYLWIKQWQGIFSGWNLIIYPVVLFKGPLAWVLIMGKFQN